MTALLIIIGVVLVLIAFVFGWFNAEHSSIIPFPALILGGALILFGLGGALL